MDSNYVLLPFAYTSMTTPLTPHECHLSAFLHYVYADPLNLQSVVAVLALMARHVTQQDIALVKLVTRAESVTCA